MGKHRLDDQYREKFRPDVDAKLDEQVDAALSEVSIEDLYSFDKPRAGESGAAEKGVRRGRIVSIEKDDAFVDFGGKSQGIVPLIQFEEVPKVGEEREFQVERYDAAEGLLILSIKGAAATNVTWETLEVGQVVEGSVTGVNKGGLELSVKNMRAFMPAGQVDVYHVPDLSQFINQKVTAEVTAFEREGRNIVLSRRNVLEREREESKKKLLEELAEGQIRRGTVRNVLDFGAFVDLGGIEGLLHVSEMSFRRVRNPNEIVKVGDVVDVKILKIDREGGKLSLSLKQARGIDPWADAGAKYATGVAVTGRVTKVESFGAFIEVEEGVEGLLPISEMSYQRVKSAGDIVKEGDTLRLVVLSIDPLARRLSFSLKQAGPDPWKTAGERYPLDTVVPGTVSRVVDFGAFVELEPGLEGLIHISELSEQRLRSAGDAVKQGQTVNVRVMEIDPQGRRISLSLKRAVGAMSADAGAGQIPPAKKKKRPELRGGLDFDMRRLFHGWLSRGIVVLCVAAGTAATTWAQDRVGTDVGVGPDSNVAARWAKMFDRDKFGFTVFPLGDAARIILVSSTDGSDFNDGMLQPVRSLKKALTLARSGFPDRILFKRGDVFREANLAGNIQLQGRSFLEPLIIGAYGDIRQPRPVLERMLAVGGRPPPRFLVFQSLDLYAESRDASQPAFNPKQTSRLQAVGINLVNSGSFLWIEDCRVRDFGMGMVLQSKETDLFHTLIIRRCQVVDSWDFGHSSGIYVDNFDNVLVEENLFDHNGWNEAVDRAGKTIFNHDMYFQHGEEGEDRHVIVRDNIIARASSHGCQLRPGGLLENNLFLKNPLAAFVSFSPSVVRNNVVLDGDGIGPTQPRGKGLEVLNCPTALVEGNIVAHKSDKTNWESAFSYDPIVRGERPMPSSGEFRDNVVYDWAGPAFALHSPSTGLSVHDNIFEQDGFPLIEMKEMRKDYRFENNDYSSSVALPFSIGGTGMDLKSWRAASGDKPKGAGARFADPARDISSYAAAIGLPEASLEGFLGAARQQRRGQWDGRLTAQAVNDYIRAGFAVKAVSAGTQP